VPERLVSQHDAGPTLSVKSGYIWQWDFRQPTRLSVVRDEKIGFSDAFITGYEAEIQLLVRKLFIGRVLAGNFAPG